MTSVFKKKNLLALRIVLFVALLLLAGVVAFAEASDSEMLPGFDAPDSYFIFVQKEVKGLEKDQLTDLSFKIINSVFTSATHVYNKIYTVHLWGYKTFT